MKKQLQTYQIPSTIDPRKCLRMYTNQNSVNLSIVHPHKYTDITLSPEDIRALIAVLNERLAEVTHETNMG